MSKEEDPKCQVQEVGRKKGTNRSKVGKGSAQGFPRWGELETLRLYELQLATPAALPESDTVWPSSLGPGLPVRKETHQSRATPYDIPVLPPQAMGVADVTCLRLCRKKAGIQEPESHVLRRWQILITSVYHQ